MSCVRGMLKKAVIMHLRIDPPRGASRARGVSRAGVDPGLGKGSDPCLTESTHSNVGCEEFNADFKRRKQREQTWCSSPFGLGVVCEPLDQVERDGLKLRVTPERERAEGICCAG